MRALHIFPHGLGDTVMFSAVLRHLRKHHPDWHNFVVAADGRQTALDGLATTIAADFKSLSHIQQNSYVHAQTRPGLLSSTASEIAVGVGGAFDHAFEHVWPECPVSYADAPSTKTVWCLKEVFGLPIDHELLQYFIAIAPENREMVDRYVNALPAGKFAVIHYQGHTATQAKSLSIGEVKEMCDFLVARKITPVILDWTLKNPLSDGKRIFHPGRDHDLWGVAGTGCAQVIAALMERAAVTISIDSGPGKVALATKNTPALQVWRHMHPIHYCDYAPHAFHLVPTTHVHCIRGVDKSIGLDFFNNNYRYAVYQENQLGRAMGEFAWRMASGVPLDTKHDDDSIKVFGPKSPVRILAEAEPSRFVVGIPTLNRGDRLRGLMDQIECCSSHGELCPDTVVVIDNGNQLCLSDAPGDYGWMQVLRPSRNIGVAASWNLLHKLASPLPLILLNDDVDIRPDTFSRMLAVDAPLVTAAGFSAFLIRESAWTTVGEFDENFYPAYHEDGDYRWRCQLKGIATVDIDAGVKHEPSQTRKRFTPAEDVAFMERWQECHELYQQKWGGLPGREVFDMPYNGKVRP